MAERNILVVASDYEIVQQVRQALHGRGFVIHSTFSHSDTVYSLKQGSQFDVALIDAEMHSRRTGDHTLLMVTELSMRPPLIAIALNGGVDDIGDLQAEQVITTLDEYEIQRVVMHALRIPVITPSHQTRQLNTESPEAREAARRLDEIQTLFSLSRSLTEVLNLSEVLNRVVEAARRLTGAEQGMILLPDEQEPKQLWLRARVGLDIEVARNFRIKDDSNLTKTVFTKGESLLIGAQGPQKIKTEFFVNSLLYVPILLKGSPIGVLGVTNKASHDVFTDVHQELMENLASYAAIAIENARIHEESVKQARELRALVDASNVINSSVSLERTLPNICDQLHLALSVNRIEILKWSPEDDSLRTLTRYFRAATRATDIAAVDLRQRPAMRATLEHNECVWAARSGSQVMGETDALEATGAGATLVLPIFISNHPLGVVQAYYVDPLNQPPSTEVLEQAQLLGLQALTGIANADSTHAAKNSRRLGYDINGLLGSDWCECALLSKDKQSLAIRIMAGQAVWLTPPYPSLDVQDYPLLQRAIQKQDPFYLQQGDTILQNGSEKLLSYTQSRALLCIPLVNRGQSQGMVLLGDAERSRVFNDHEIELARAITGQAAMALENAQLVHDLEASLIELKETQGRLIQAAKLTAMGEMAATVAHQINNPLTTIKLDAELMLLKEDQESARYEPLSAIVRAADRSAEVVKRLLATARPGNPNAPAEPVDVAAIVEDVVALVKTYVERSRVTLDVRLPEEPLPSVWAAPGELDDVWLNLLLNAHDALSGRPDPVIGISVEHLAGDKYVNVEVWDNGPGIPERILNDIFRPFFTTKPEGEGTGLGLHICRQVIERVGGTISVESAPEEGTRFFVKLPTKRGEQ